MTRATAARLALALVWLEAALAVSAYVRPWELALALQAPLLLLSNGLAEWAFRRLAAPAEITADLEERARNGP